MAFGVKRRESEGKQPTRYFSDRQEKAIAKAVGGKQTANSGATPWQKGDILTEDFLLEAKTKTVASESIAIKKAWIDKNRQEMAFMGKKHQAIVFNFGPGEENHYIIDEYLFQELLEHLESKKNS